MIGKKSMKSWQAAVRTWEKRKNEKPTEQRKHTDTSYDISELEQRILYNNPISQNNDLEV